MESTTCEEHNLNRGTVQQFITERRYLKNVTPKTIAWYEQAFKSFDSAIDSRAAIVQRIAELRERGVKAVSVNSWLRVLNAFFNWNGTPLKIPRLKEEQNILGTLSPEQIKMLVAFKPKGLNQTRTHIAAMVLLDTGLRISELLGLQYEHCDFDNLVVKVKGKGNKHRLVPLSSDMRRVLYRYAAKHSAPNRLVFGTRHNTQVTVRNFERDFKLVGQKLGITGVRLSPHTLRHTFACEYLKRGGNLEFLRRILGHSSILTTQKYLRSLGVDDLRAAHEGLSPLTMDRGARMDAR